MRLDTILFLLLNPADKPLRPGTNRSGGVDSPLATARQMITAESGTQFDPDVVEAFNSIGDEIFAQIAAEIG